MAPEAKPAGKKPMASVTKPAVKKPKASETNPAAKKPLLEYREPMSNLGERYLGACKHPFTKKQIETVAEQMPPYFSSIKGYARGDQVCLFTSAVFLTRTRDAMVKSLKTSCTKWAGTGSEKACQELISDLSPAKPTTTQTASLKGDPDFKPYNPHDPAHYDPRKWPFWAKQIDGATNAFWFAALGIAVHWVVKKATGKSILQHAKEYLKNGKDGDDDDTPKFPPTSGYDLPEENWKTNLPGLSKMVAAALGMAAALAGKLDDIEMPPIVPLVPFDLNPVHPIGSAPIGFEDPNYVPLSTSTSISWAAAVALLDSAATAIEEIWRPNPHSKTSLDRWADRKIGEPMAQAGRNMAVSMTAGAKKLMSVKPKHMPTVAFVGLVIFSAPVWVPAVLAYGTLSLVGSMIGPTWQELMNERDKMTGKKRPGPA